MTYFSGLKLSHCKLIPVLLIIEATTVIPWCQLSKLALTVTKQLCYLKIYLKDKLEHLLKGDYDCKEGSYNTRGVGGSKEKKRAKVDLPIYAIFSGWLDAPN